MAKFSSILAVASLILVMRWALCLDLHEQEAHIIMKRLAEGEGRAFEGHDVAKVHKVECQGQCKRRLSKRDLRRALNTTAGGESQADGDSVSVLHLDLSSGSRVTLTLTPAVGIVGPDTEVTYLTSNGRVKRKRGVEDCYARGHVGDSSGEGVAVISHCDGVFGFATSHEYEYFLHPVEARGESKRSKQEVDDNDDDDDDDDEEQHEVHVMWRRRSRRSKREIIDEPNDFIESSDDVAPMNGWAPGPQGDEADQINATELVIEIAMFSDAHYWRRLQNLYPGREDEYLLVRLTGSQLLYTNHEAVGYDVKIKLKLLEYWVTDPAGYGFTQTFSHNLRNGCPITTKSYSYDVHAINSGITDWNGGEIGLAYVQGACRPNRCLITNSVDFHSFVGFAHELGHTLGMKHRSQANCPSDTKAQGAGFMGGKPYKFSPCMKHQMDHFIDSGKADCLFRESHASSLASGEHEVLSVFPGQSRTPDELCELMAGPGFKFGPQERQFGEAICKLFVCLNENATSPEFGRIHRFLAPTGQPCRETSFCDRDMSCRPWHPPEVAKHLETLRSQIQHPEWSKWSRNFSSCSRSCGTGVRTKRRRCLVKGPNLFLPCQGHVVKPELCNTQPCPGEPKTSPDLRKLRGDEVCSRFLQNDVVLKGNPTYLAVSQSVTSKDMGPRWDFVHSKSCLLKCQRVLHNAKGDMDAIMPDGTPCHDRTRSLYELSRLNIDLRCVRGLCREFSDCPYPGQVKDECGVCDGDGSSCVELHFKSNTHKIDRHERISLSVIPAGSTNIDVYVYRKNNLGLILELWSMDGRGIIGDGGLYPRGSDHDDVEFAGTRWSYRHTVSYLRAPGPLTEAVEIKTIRLYDPLRQIRISYSNASAKGTDTVK